MTERRFTLWEVTFVFYCVGLSLIEVDVNAVTTCMNRLELLEGLLLRTPSENYFNAPSFIPPYSPSEARTSGIGWCSDDLTCNSTERQFIEVDFGAEVIIEAVAILRAGGSYVTHYSVEYAGSDRHYHCVRISNETVFDGNRTCNLNMDPSNFANPVVARYIRIIPIQWVGASICLRLALYGCTIKECRNVSILDRVDLVSDLSNPVCTPFLEKIFFLRFNTPSYLTQLRARSNAVTMNISFRTNQTLLNYQNTIGMENFRLTFNTRVVIPLWAPINTTYLELMLIANIPSQLQVCFAVELTGCLSDDVIDHTKNATILSMSADNVRPCNRPNPAPTPSGSSLSTSSEPAITDTHTVCQSTSVYRSTSIYRSTSVYRSTLVYRSTSVVIVQSTSFVTVNTVKVTASTMAQQLEASSDDDSCNIIAIVVPTALVVIGLVVIVCINIIVVIKMRKRSRKDITTSTNKHTTCVVENDLYQSQDSAKEATDTRVISQYSVVDTPDRDSPTASGGDDVPVYSKVAENREYDYLTHPPLKGNDRTPEYEVIVDPSLAEKNGAYYSVPKTPAVVVNPSYTTTGDQVVHNTDEQ